MYTYINYQKGNILYFVLEQQLVCTLQNYQWYYTKLTVLHKTSHYITQSTDHATLNNRKTTCKSTTPEATT